VSVHIRPYADGDADQIAAILDATYGYDPRLRALHGGGHGPPLDQPFRRTLVAEIDGELVGVGTILHGSFHPIHTWLDLVVSPDTRRRGIGTAVFDELRARAPTPLCARVRYDQPGAIRFFQRHQVGLINRSWEGRFDPAEVAGRLPEPQPETPPSLDEAAEFFERWYHETHQWDPPTRMSLDDARALFCGENVIPGSFAGVRANGHLIAAGNLVRPFGYDPGDELYLVWVGTDGRKDEAATIVVGACVRFALEAGKAVRFELDESNASVWTALDRLGVLGKPALAFFAEDG
jgi:GNAT superfamily N-acetyltransferase